VLTERESYLEQRKLHPLIKPVTNHEITMVIPGRRALGETWTRVTIGHDADNITYAAEPADAPADGKTIMAMTGKDAEMASYILTSQMEKAKARAVAPQELTAQERYEMVNEAWQAYVEQKLRALKGQSTFGPGGSTQRQRTHQNPATRPAMHK
jgi:hypothetical protein